MQTLLLVEPDASDRHSYRTALQHSSTVALEILDASTAAAAITLHHQHSPDVVLLSECLPNVEALVQQLQRSPHAFSLIVLLQPPPLPAPETPSQHLLSESVSLEKWLALGAVECLDKSQMTATHLRWAVQRSLSTLTLQSRLQQTEYALVNAQANACNQTEAALQASEERFHLATLAIAGVIYDWNVETNEIYRSEGLRDLLGWFPHEVPATQEWWDAQIHPDDLVILKQQEQAQCLQGSDVVYEVVGDRYESEYRIRHRDGQWLYVWDRGYRVRNSAGQIIRVVGSTSDISGRKRAEQALRDSQNQMRRLFESNIIGLLFATPDGITDANDGFLKMLDYSRADVVARKLHWQDITPPEYAPLDQKCIAELSAVGSCTPFEKEYIRKDGSRVPILIGAVEVSHDPLCWLCFVVDLTRNKQLEQELRRQKEELLQASHIKDEFLTVLSHELRTPLNPILGWAKLLQTRQLATEKIQEGLATIERNAKLQAQLVDDLLDVSRIMRGKLVLDLSPVKPLVPTLAALETIRLAAEAKSIRLETQMNPQVGLVMGDATRLQQVVWNLLSNAIKFTPEGGKIEVHLTRELPDSVAEPQSLEPISTPTFVKITVTDTGKGIHADFLPHVFDLFRQQDGSTTRRFGGLGLGLAIVRQLVEAHGGTVAVSSGGEGSGTTFTVRLPLIPESVGSSGNITPPVETPDLHNVRILLVDDEVDSLAVIATVLETEGANVTTTATTAEALLLLEQSRFDLLVSDIGMPDMDGYALLRKIRSLPVERGGKIPAIALTAYAAETHQEQAYEAGFQQHLPKPVEPDALVGAIATLLKSRTD